MAIIMVISFLTSTSLSAEIHYFIGDIEKAKIKAAQESKLLLLDFYADWCAPCKWMDEKTFTDPEVKKLIMDNFVPIKINIDDFDGYALKQFYDIKVLPTIVVFDKDGRIIQRAEKTLSPSGLIAFLSESMNHSKPLVHAPNTSPGKASTPSSTTHAKTKTETIDEDAPRSYKIQLGVFSSYQNTLKYYHKLSAILTEPIVILHDFKAGNVIYRVLAGDFKDVDKASDYMKVIKSTFDLDSTLHKP